MKEIKTNRFAKEESINFDAHPITNTKPSSTPVKKPTIRQNLGQDSLHSINKFQITVPKKRVRIRHAFEIYGDQLQALKKIQDASRDLDDSKLPSLADMAREAFDDFIKARAKSLENIDISYE